MGTGYWCPDCSRVLDGDDVTDWVREAERSRDQAYLEVEGREVDNCLLEASQREVYRRRKVSYELQNLPQAGSKPEMVLVVYDSHSQCYECRIFYKEPRPAWCMERLSIEASEVEIRSLTSHSDPVVRAVAGKVVEFHAGREAVDNGNYAPSRRVFDANEL
ncbi:hypothetical protein BH23ACT11_BH23ACT11_14140 [soil metagenome]